MHVSSSGPKILQPVSGTHCTCTGQHTIGCVGIQRHGGIAHCSIAATALYILLGGSWFWTPQVPAPLSHSTNMLCLPQPTNNPCMHAFHDHPCSGMASTYQKAVDRHRLQDYCFRPLLRFFTDSWGRTPLGLCTAGEFTNIGATDTPIVCT
jgi:hypothetical protein